MKNLSVVMTTWFGVVLALLFYFALVILGSLVVSSVLGLLAPEPMWWVATILNGLFAYTLGIFIPLRVLRPQGKRILAERRAEREQQEVEV